MEDRGRHAMLTSVEYRLDGADSFTRALVKDVAGGGLKIKVGVELSAGSPIELQLPNVGLTKGRVAWSQGGFAGIEFDQAIDPALLKQKITGSYRGPPLPQESPKKRIL